MIRIIIIAAIAAIVTIVIMSVASKLSNDEHKAKSREITDGFRESIDEVAKKMKENQ